MGHKSTTIRTAYSDDLRGPWTLFRPDARVLSLGDGIRMLGPPLESRRHIASPDVHLDHESRRFGLCFHGPVWLAGTRIIPKRTLVATSPDGLAFDGRIEAVLDVSPFGVA